MTSRHRPTRRRRRRRRGGGGGTHREFRRRAASAATAGTPRAGGAAGWDVRKPSSADITPKWRVGIAWHGRCPSGGTPPRIGIAGQAVAALRQERRGGGAAAAVAVAAHRWRPQRRARSVAAVAGVVPCARQTRTGGVESAQRRRRRRRRASELGVARVGAWGMSSGFPGVGPSCLRPPQDIPDGARLATYVRGGKRRRPTRGVTRRCLKSTSARARARAGGGGGGLGPWTRRRSESCPRSGQQRQRWLCRPS